jgi:hypothetical protein
LAGGFVHGLHACHFPVAVRELHQLLAGKIVEIEMTETGAFAGPQEALAIGEKWRSSGC